MATVGPAFPVVAIGASAGGVEALNDLFTQLPENSGAAFIVIQHLSPDRESQLAGIIGRKTKMTVAQVEGTVRIKPNHVYVTPPDKYLRIIDHQVRTEAPVEEHGRRMPIDYFMASLARVSGSNSLGVVLSGTGSDGTVGLGEIRTTGGYTLAQTPDSALYGDMPKSAIDAECVDFSGDIEELVKCLGSCIERLTQDRDAGSLSGEDIASVVAVLKARTGHDFSAYKKGTLSRRIRRRMNLLRYDTVPEYVTHVRSSPDEAGQLLHDLLINVTRFFRDEDAWNSIAETVIAPLMEIETSEPVRVWVPACASGEEAYSLAILLSEAAAKSARSRRWQIFATDLDTQAIASARAAVYPASIAADVDPERLKTWFEPEGDGFRVTKQLREQVVFASQNLLNDPPFSRLDIISCRNVLIYLSNPTQKKLLELFAFALVDNGALILGTSESVPSNNRSFVNVDSTSRIYRRANGVARRPIGMGKSGALSLQGSGSRASGTHEGPLTMAERVRRSLLESFGPGSAVITSDGTVHYFHGPIRRLLETPEGEPSRNLYDLLPPPLRGRLRDAVRAAAEVGEGRAEVSRVPTNDGVSRIEILARPLPGLDVEPLYVCSFAILPVAEIDIEDGDVPADAGEVRRLERDLVIAREELQTTIEELETSNEELKASNEEATAANEELQSSNEELETSREELQSLNEELVTVNAQLEDKISEVEQATADLRNLFQSSRLPVLFLDGDLRIRDYTETLRDLFELREGDEGRPITDLRERVPDPGLVETCRKVLRDLTPAESEISDETGRTFLRLVHPYRTGDNRIDGVVLTYTDISASAHTARLLARRESQARTMATLGQVGLTADSESEFLQSLSERLRRQLSCDFVQVLRWNEPTRRFETQAGIGWDSDMPGQTVDADGQAGFTLRHGGTVLVTDNRKETRFQIGDEIERHEIRSGMSIPVSVDGYVWGVLALYARAPRSFDTEDLNLLRAAANIIAATLSNLTRKREVERERTTLRLAVEAAELAIWSLDRTDSAAPSPAELSAALAAPMAGPKGRADLHDEDRDRVLAAIARTLREDLPFVEEYRIILDSGEIRWLASRGALLENDGSRRIVGVLFDVTERREAHEYQRLILRELDHRVKNMLAIIISIARITGKGAPDLPSFLESFSDRLNAMSRTHSLLAEARWKGVTLEALAREELEQYATHRNIRVEGPQIGLSIAAAQAMSMALHELATNAAKYGALSTEGGTVELTWNSPDHEGRYRLTWAESGGPPVTPPTSKGFGSTVIESILTAQLRAEVETVYKPEGLQVRVSIPEHVVRGRLPEFAPRSAAEEDARTPLARDRIGGLEGRRILVVDDEWLIAEQHRRWLVEAGAATVAVTDTASARRELAEAVPEAAVVDYNLGLETATELVADLREANVPILIVTGYGGRRELAAGLSDLPLLRKPLQESDLLAAVAHLVEEGRT